MMRSLSVALLCALLLVIVALMGGAHGAHSFSAHRVAQFDRDGERFGSRRTLINNQLASVDWSSPSASSDLHRKVVAVRIGDLSVGACVCGYSKRAQTVRARMIASSVCCRVTIHFFRTYTYHEA